ncbi:MAG TPA: lactate racemase domain-containing protein [Terriglobales bacterium]|jgi:nickel-dependent lactate racemase|nr:lactate racemase domain-containing protein [Terriglobales bacterium]
MTVASEPISVVTGSGDPHADLSPAEMRNILREALGTVPTGSSVLAIVADKTRDDNTDVLFPAAGEILAERGIEKLDVLIAQGTHQPMTDTEKRAKIGAVGIGIAGLRHIFDHDWADPRKLTTIGQLDAARINELSAGLMDSAISLRVNQLLKKGLYDTVLVFGTTMPHEVAGFSGGAKYFFPGVSGPELTHATHWLGALASIEKIIGRVETPPRHLFEAAADFIPAKIISLNSVVSRDNGWLRTHALFCGDFRRAMRQAAAISRHVHIKYTGRKYKRVVALLDSHYDDLWVGGKASYRLGPIIEEAGALIIYAPHLTTISETHGSLIKRYGYAPLERVRELVSQSEELRQNLCVAAHLAHVSFAGKRLHDGTIVPRYSITLASAVDQTTCEQVNLRYMDPRTFRLSDYTGDPDALVVEHAGRDLYLVEPLEN